MKTLIKYFTVLALFLFLSTSAEAQLFSRTEIEILTSAQCPMCKASIEKTLTFEKGVSTSLLDMETKKVTVRFNNRRTAPETLRKAISAIGYDADAVKADREAYAKLPACCKKPNDPTHQPHR